MCVGGYSHGHNWETEPPVCLNALQLGGAAPAKDPPWLHWKFRVCGNLYGLAFGCIPQQLQVVHGPAGTRLCDTLTSQPPPLCVQDDESSLRTCALSACNQRPVSVSTTEVRCCHLGLLLCRRAATVHWAAGGRDCADAISSDRVSCTSSSRSRTSERTCLPACTMSVQPAQASCWRLNQFLALLLHAS